MSYIGAQPTSAAYVTDSFSGNASTTAFTMSVAPATTSSMLVSISGVLQDPTAYSINGTTLTFSSAPPTGTGNISVRYLGIPASGVTTTAYRTVTEFTATAGQTSFTVPSYTAGYINVFRNGVRLGSADFAATTGTSVVLTNAATAGDLVMTESFYVSSVSNAFPQSGGTINAVSNATPLIIQNNGTTSATFTSSGLLNINSGSFTQAVGSLNVGGTGTSGWIGQFGNAAGTTAVLLGVRNSLAAIGSQGATTMALNPDGGQITMPSQSAFIAYMTTTSTATTIPFNATSLNRGSHFNTSTYTYTAPAQGLYTFTVIIAYDGNSTNPNASYIALSVNGTRARDLFEGNPAWTTNTEWHSSAFLYLNAGDTVTISNPGAGNIQAGNAATYYSLFSGCFLG